MFHLNGTVISMARHKKPYLVVPMKYTDVMDYKDFAKKCCPNLKISSTGVRVNWLKVKWIQVKQEEPRSLFINYPFSEDTFIEIKVQGMARQRGKPMHGQQNYQRAMMAKYQ